MIQRTRTHGAATRSTAILAFLAGCAAVAPAQNYTLTDLGALGGPTSGGFAVNNFGRATGVATLADANTHAFLWAGAMTDIAPLAGDQQCHAFGISDGDRVVAASYDLGDVIVRGFVWDAGSTTPIGLAPRGVTNSGIVVGYATSNDASYGWVDHAVRWVNGALLDMGTMGGHNSYAYSAAEDGRIVGMSFLANDSTRRAYLWISGVFHDLGTLGGVNSQAYAINEAGDVVGWSELITGAPHAFLFRTDANGNVTTRTNLGDLGRGHSCAYGINNAQKIVGTSSSRAFVWDNGVMRDLNTLVTGATGWRLDAAWDINDDGQIVGTGVYYGFPRAFLLTPERCPDVNGDGTVDLADLATLIAHFGTASGAARTDGDVDGDGDVDLSDLAQLLANFGIAC